MNIGVAVNTCPAGVLFVSTCGFCPPWLSGSEDNSMKFWKDVIRE